MPNIVSISLQTTVITTFEHVVAVKNGLFSLNLPFAIDRHLCVLTSSLDLPFIPLCHSLYPLVSYVPRCAYLLSIESFHSILCPLVMKMRPLKDLFSFSVIPCAPLLWLFLLIAPFFPLASLDLPSILVHSIF